MEITPVAQAASPLHPAKTDPGAGVALSVTVLLTSKRASQAAPQEILAGVEVTVPEPVPARLTDRVCCCAVKVAVTVVVALSETIQVPVPEQDDSQPANMEPTAGVAVRLTWVPVGKVAAQVPPQAMPIGLEVTVPAPVPIRSTESS